MNLLDNLDNPKVVESWHAMDTWVQRSDPDGRRRLPPADQRLLQREPADEGHADACAASRSIWRNVRANLLNVIAEADHITPPCQSENVMPMFGSKDKEIERIKGGHIGLMLSSTAEKITWPRIEAWLAAHSD